MASPTSRAKSPKQAAKKRIRRAMDSAGVTARVKAVEEACVSARFQELFSAKAAAAGDDCRDMRGVSTMALAALDEMGVSHRGISVKFSWDPSERRLGVFVRPNAVAAQVAAAAMSKLRGMNGGKAAASAPPGAGV